MNFYTLQIKTTHIGFNRNDLYVYDNLNKIIDKLSKYLLTPIGCYETVLLNNEIILEKYMDGKSVEKIDFHSYIVYTLNNYPTILFDPNNEPIIWDINDVFLTKDDVELLEYFNIHVLSNDVNIGVHIEVPNIGNLTGKYIEKDDIITIQYHRVYYGYNDLLDEHFFSDDDSRYLSDDS